MTARRLLVSTVAVTAATMCPVAGANMVYGFGCFVSGASTANCTSATSQLTMEVAEAGAQQVLFLFRNVGTSPMSLTDIYFDDGTLLGVAGIVNYPDPGSIVSFGLGAKPANLPGGTELNPDFETSGYGGSSHYFSIDSNPVRPGTMSNGVGPGERVGVLFDLQPGATYTGTLAALALAGATEGLRVGLHVQGFADGGSLSLINDPMPLTPVPLPAAAPLLLLGVVGLGRFIRRRQG